MGFWHILAYGVVTFLVIRGFWRGFSGEIGGLAGLLGAAVVWCIGLGYAERAVEAAGWFSGTPFAGKLAAFGLVLTACVAVWLLVGHLLKTALKMTIGQPFDALLGGMVGAAKAALVILAVQYALKL